MVLTARTWLLLLVAACLMYTVLFVESSQPGVSRAAAPRDKQLAPAPRPVAVRGPAPRSRDNRVPVAPMGEHAMREPGAEMGFEADEQGIPATPSRPAARVVGASHRVDPVPAGKPLGKVYRIAEDEY